MLYVFGILFTCVSIAYLHKTAANLAYYLHEPAVEPLKDVGFLLLKEIAPKYQMWSEVVFFLPIISMFAEIFKELLLWIVYGSSFSTAYLMFMRFAITSNACAILRCLSFLSTMLPGPRYHCRPGSKKYNPPKNVKEIFTRTDFFNGCGDLIFSNHTVLNMTANMILIDYIYPQFYMKIYLWACTAVFLLLVIACRKHYTVDIVVALYVVPLMYSYLYTHMSDEWLLSLI